MTQRRMVNDSVHLHMQELSSRVVARSGIPTDRHHVGKLILQSLKDAPDFVLQIDGATGESETCGSVLQRTVRCAQSLRNLGLKHGDVLALMAPNHLDLCIPLYAAFYLGIIVVAIHRSATMNELKYMLTDAKPKIIFCQSIDASTVQQTLFNLNMKAPIITFDNADQFSNFSHFMEQYGDDTSIEDFQCSDFDPEESIVFLTATSGSTGSPKTISHSHKYFAILLPYLWLQYSNFPTPTRLALILTPIAWSTSLTSFIRSPILRYTRLQTSKTLTQQHVYDLINTYKPTYSILPPSFMTWILKPSTSEHCDFTSFELIMLAGMAVTQNIVEQIKAVSPNTQVLDIYGMSELAGLAFLGDNAPPGSSGKPIGCFQYRLVDTETQRNIDEPNVTGELWIKSVERFKGYYSDIECTKATITEDGWLNSGDLFYRDENWNFFYVDRIKLMFKCMYIKISPLEIESVIRKHPGVLNVAVTSISHDEWGDTPLAFVVPRPGAKPSADEIKDLVKDSLEDAKRLRGGVIFIDSMPLTATTKVDRRKLRQMALVLPRA